jgi:hypothetical protein
MQQKLTRLRSQIERLEARMAEAETALPAWAAKGTQGFLMIAVHLRDLLARISQANDPDWYWFNPAEPIEQAWREAAELCRAMLASDCYGDALQLANAALDKYPPYRYHPGNIDPQTKELP